MLAVLAHPLYRRLFAAQVVALLGTGLLTVALSLLAYDLAGAQAGAVLGTAYAIKMVAYVGLSPLTGALAERWPRRAVLVAADLLRAGVALCLPFIDAVWQIYVLIFLLQAASATFTPVFQATIPDVLPEEGDYTRALSLSRLAYDLENLLSPALAGLLLLVMSYSWLFSGTVMGFLASAALVLATRLPPRREQTRRSFGDRLTRGMRIYLATPRLRGLLAFNLSAAAAGAFVLVNTVVLVQAGYDRSESGVALAMAAFGAGSMLAALALPRLLERWRDRPVMGAGAAALALLTALLGVWLLLVGLPAWSLFLVLWALTGLAYGAVLTPAGRLLRRSSGDADRQAVFTAQFALSHACWLVTYPAAGWIAGAAGGATGLGLAALALGVLAAAGAAMGRYFWPATDALELPHAHPDLPANHPHLRQRPATGRSQRHTHAFVIDDEHRVWPTHG
jgi:MFS family permease